ncbi:MAG: helix-turn-helix domain-containing protein [Candidatus Sungbacteria bacterium]|nr:helix-turn-helix domain-containing protein [Candidatus Sungbacteria bacterium]
MTRISRYPLTSRQIEELSQRIIDTVTLMRSKEELALFFNDLLTRTEKIMLGKRLLIAFFLQRGYSYAEISRWLKVSQTTISSIKENLERDGRGFRVAMKKLEKEIKIERIFERIKQGLNVMPPMGKGRWRFSRQ